MAVAAQARIVVVIGMATVAIGVAGVIEVHLPPDRIRIVAVLAGAVVVVLGLVMAGDTGVIRRQTMIVVADPPSLGIVTGRTGDALKVSPRSAVTDQAVGRQDAVIHIGVMPVIDRMAVVAGRCIVLSWGGSGMAGHTAILGGVIRIRDKPGVGEVTI